MIKKVRITRCLQWNNGWCLTLAAPFLLENSTSECMASNWLELLPAGSITTWEDLTTRFLDQFFPSGRTAKLRNDILIRTIDQSAGGKLRDRNAKESWALLENLALYDNESWNDPRDFAKPVKVIALPQDVPSTSDRRLIELENQVQRLMEAHLAPMQPTQEQTHYHHVRSAWSPQHSVFAMEIRTSLVKYASTSYRQSGDESDYDRGCRKPSDLEDGFYKDTIKLGPEYLTRMDDEGECHTLPRRKHKA
ncbi:MAK10-like protein [Tanacetum coccineum]